MFYVPDITKTHLWERSTNVNLVENYATGITLQFSDYGVGWSQAKFVTAADRLVRCEVLRMCGNYM